MILSPHDTTTRYQADVPTPAIEVLLDMLEADDRSPIPLTSYGHNLNDKSLDIVLPLRGLRQVPKTDFGIAPNHAAPEARTIARKAKLVVVGGFATQNIFTLEAIRQKEVIFGGGRSKLVTSTLTRFYMQGSAQATLCPATVDETFEPVDVSSWYIQLVNPDTDNVNSEETVGGSVIRIFGYNKPQ